LRSAATLRGETQVLWQAGLRPRPEPVPTQLGNERNLYDDAENLQPRGGKQLKAGNYSVQWDGNGPNVQLNILRGKSVVAVPRRGWLT
jgi:hypothetical protein